MWLFHAADSRLGYAHSPAQLNLGQFGCLPQRGQAHRIGAVSLFHVTANLGDALGQIWPLSQLADAVVTADELNFLCHRCFPSARPSIDERFPACRGARVEHVADRLLVKADQGDHDFVGGGPTRTTPRSASISTPPRGRRRHLTTVRLPHTASVGGVRLLGTVERRPQRVRPVLPGGAFVSSSRYRAARPHRARGRTSRGHHGTLPIRFPARPSPGAGPAPPGRACPPRRRPGAHLAPSPALR